MRYQVYGLGNALVDMEYEVSPEQLTELGIDKGVMTLVELEQQHNVITSLGTEQAKKSSGGSAANSLIALAQLGGKACYACRVADDQLGQFYLRDLLQAGIETGFIDSNLPSTEHGVTGTCLVMVTPDADRTMNTYLGISADFSSNDIDEQAICDAEYVYVEGYLVPGNHSREAAIKSRQIAEQAGIKTAISLSDPNMVKFFKSGLQDMIGDGVDLLFANENEALGMADTDTLENAISYLQGIAKSFVITRGAKGALIYQDSQILEVPATKVNPVDTNGAGDMFAGTYLYGITHGMSAEQAGQLASMTAAKLIAKYGARLPAATTQAVFAEFQAH